MSDINKRRNYDLAQQLGENMEVLENCKGWIQVIVPEFMNIRDIAQEKVNSIDTPIREADHQRGVLETCNLILSIVEEKKSASKNNMASNRG